MRPIAVLAFVLAAAAPRLTVPPASPVRFATLPAVSPDGRWIAFLSERDSTSSQVCLIRSEGGELRRLPGAEGDLGAPGWIAGDRIVYPVTRGESTTVMRIDPSGDAPRPVVTVAGKSPALSHDGRRVAFAQGAWTRNRIVVADLSGGEPRVLVDSTEGGSFNFAWSPGDSAIAYTHIAPNRDMQVWIVDVAGAHARALTHFTAEDGRPQWPSWSPDAHSIAVQSGRYDRQDPARSTSNVWQIDVSSGAATKLAAHERPYLDETPSYFPDGHRIAIQSTRSGRFDLWVIGADGAGATRLTH
jgi:Tol biopolymer transport system component